MTGAGSSGDPPFAAGAGEFCVAESFFKRVSPWAAMPRPSRLPPRLRAELVRQLYAFAPGIGISSAALVLMIGLSMAARSADAWLAGLTLLAATLLLVAAPIKRALLRAGEAAPPIDARRGVVRFTLFAWTNAAVLGAMIARGLGASGDPIVELIFFAFAIGAAATALRSFLWPPILLGQLALGIGPSAAVLAWHGDQLTLVLSLMLLMFGCHMATIGIGLYRQAVASLMKDAELEAQAARLTESDERYRLATLATRDMIWDWDISSDRVTRARNGGLIFGYDIAELPDAAAGWMENIHPDDRAEMVARLDAAVESGGDMWTARYRYRRPDGSYAHVLDRGFIVRDAEGRPVRLVGAASDISERLEMMAALRESEEHYRHRAEYDPHSTWVCDADGSLVEISSHWTEDTGLPVERALGQGWLEAVHPEDLPGAIEDFARARADGLPTDMRIRFRQADGAFHWYRVRARPRRDADGRIERWYGYSENIHDQVLAELALRDSQARFATIFRQAMIGIGLSEPGKGMLMVNDRLAAILGRDPADCAGLTMADITHPDDLAWNRPLFDRHARTGQSFIIEKRYTRPDGSAVWCRTSVSFVRKDAATPLAVIVVEDLTDRKSAEAQLQRLQGELIHMSRATAMGAMGAAIAHELNQPLAAVANYSAALQMLVTRGTSAPEAIADVAGQIGGEALRAGTIVRRLRALVAKGEAETAPEDLAALIEETNTLALLGTTNAGIVCEVEHEAPLVVLADRVQVQQVLVNLVRNAIESMRDSRRRRLRITTAAADGAALIAIEDSGAGLSAEIREHLFEPFSTTKEGGMGIGLSICRTIIEAHGGRIWAEDAPGGGTRFAFTLPLAEADAPRRRRHARATEDA